MFLPHVMQPIQGLGKLDAELCAEDNAFFIGLRAARETSPSAGVRFAIREGENLSDRIQLSILWLFGAYEIVRTVSGALHRRHHTFGAATTARAQAVKLDLARPRMLLAKFEPATAHMGDLVPAQPWSRNNSLAWRVAPRIIVTRRHLSDQMLKLFRAMHRRQLQEWQAEFQKQRRHRLRNNRHDPK